jgi:putative tricarboxylic transport membrane protein
MSEGNTPQKEQRRPDWAAFAIATFLFGLAALIAWDTSRLGGGGSYARIGPATFPYVIAGFFLVLAVWTAFEAWRGDFPKREKDEIAPMVWIIGGLAAQMMLLKFAGFSIATGLLFAATARGFGQRKLWLTIPIGIVLAFFVWMIFARLLQLSLPAGPLEHLFF